MAAITGNGGSITVSTVTPHVDVSMETSVTARTDLESGTAGAGQVTFQIVSAQTGANRHGGIRPVLKWGRHRLKALESIFRQMQRR